jgi:hypothetical protein
MLQKVSDIFAAKMTAKIADSKFNKAATPDAVKKAEDTKAKLAAARDRVSQALSG